MAKGNGNGNRVGIIVRIVPLATLLAGFNCPWAFLKKNLKKVIRIFQCLTHEDVAQMNSEVTT